MNDPDFDAYAALNFGPILMIRPPQSGEKVHELYPLDVTGRKPMAGEVAFFMVTCPRCRRQSWYQTPRHDLWALTTCLGCRSQQLFSPQPRQR